MSTVVKGVGELNIEVHANLSAALQKYSYEVLRQVRILSPVPRLNCWCRIIYDLLTMQSLNLERIPAHLTPPRMSRALADSACITSATESK